MGLGSDIRAGAAYVEFYAKDAAFNRAIKRVQGRLDKFAGAAKRVGGALLAGGGVVAGAGVAAKAYASLGDQIQKMSIRTGVSTEALSELGFAAQQSGTSIDQLEGALLRMNRRLGRIVGGQGSGSEVRALEALGLTARELAAMKPEERFLSIADAMAEMEDPTVAAGLAQRAFGTQVSAILPLLLEGRKGISALRSEASSLGLTMDQDTANKAAALTDAIGRVSSVFKDLVFEIGASVAPWLTRVSDLLAGSTKWVARVVSQNRELVATVITTGGVLASAGAAIIGLGVAAGVASFALGGIAAILPVIGTVAGVAGAGIAALLSPIGLVVAAIGGIGYVVATQTSMVQESVAYLSDVFGDVARVASSAFGGIRDAMKGGDLRLAAQIGGVGIKLVWHELTRDLRSLWGSFEDWILKSFNRIASNGLAYGKAALGGLRLAVDQITNDGGNRTKILGETARGIAATGAASGAIDGAIDARRSAKETELVNTLEQLRAQLRTLTGEAAQIAQEAQRDRSSRAAGLELPDIEGGARGSRRTATGVFDARTAQGAFGGSNPTEQKIERNTAAMVQDFRELARIMKQLRLAQGGVGRFT